jgi:hypothetical protein
MRALLLAIQVALLLAASALPSYAASTLKQEIDPPQVSVGDPVIVTLTLTGGTIGGIQFPPVDGLQAGGTSFQIKSSDENGTFTTSVALSISLIPTRAGDFTIPAFDIRTQEGETVHVKAMKLHVNAAASTPALPAPLPAPTPAPPPPATIAVTPSPANNPGPVVMPPTNAAASAPPSPANGNAPPGADLGVPRDPDGSLAKVFLIISPETTNAYIGESVEMEIDFFIRADVAAEQNSLPTIKGSDFLMNSFTTRGRLTLANLENQQYIRETWNTAISSPKSGDFPLSMERDTYWIKGFTNTSIPSFFGEVYGRKPILAHEMVPSNQLTMHVQPLPEEGKPAHFTGAIGQFEVTGESAPDTVAIGEPVTLRFTVRGAGNFDYVRCPLLTDDPGWKSYTPRSGTNYLEESHLHAVKTFEQSVVPRRNGNVPLPAASFSYFDPATKQYVTVPINLPNVVVTGTPPPTASVSSEADVSVAAPTPKPTDLLPNRLELGSLQGSLVPAYQHPFFWGLQTVLVALPILAAALLFLRRRAAPDANLAAEESRRRSVLQEEDAMSAAARAGDAVAFFTAARHAVQLQLGSRWSERPEAITLGEIRRRDPELAEKLSPFFAQADEVIYSGRATPGLDLAQWDQRIRTEILQPQPASL